LTLFFSQARKVVAAAEPAPAAGGKDDDSSDEEDDKPVQSNSNSIQFNVSTPALLADPLLVLQLGLRKSVPVKKVTPTNLCFASITTT